MFGNDSGAVFHVRNLCREMFPREETLPFASDSMANFDRFFSLIKSYIFMCSKDFKIDKLSKQFYAQNKDFLQLITMFLMKIC